ncbi:PD-(D/E)XK motif protein [Catellatospora vulcania]|uniref:PD-(D/E)XK motif protein n=1 Tax=Catellatospora vulcania TaxID=1460450 RepID=UPI0018AF6C7C|nr:PD-(D/E)XK motif protein [Catellatospora vulcania]
MNGSGRHLGLDGFTDYLTAGVPIEHLVPGEPRITLFVDPATPSIGLRIPARPHETFTALGLDQVKVRSVTRAAGQMVEVIITSENLFQLGYSLLCAIADRVQLQSMRTDEAIVDAVRVLGHLIRQDGAMSPQQEAGLIGELLILEGLTKVAGPVAALTMWRPGYAEHDFDVTGVDVEVKTSTAERRSHWVSSLTQLMPTGSRDLWLISLQLTEAGGDGILLPELIGQIEAALPASGREGYRRRLAAAGWRDSRARPTGRWRLRTVPSAYLVADNFPRITPNTVHQAHLDIAALRAVRYQIDLTERASSTPPTLLADALAAITLEMP